MCDVKVSGTDIQSFDIQRMEYGRINPIRHWCSYICANRDNRKARSCCDTHFHIPRLKAKSL